MANAHDKTVDPKVIVAPLTVASNGRRHQVIVFAVVVVVVEQQSATAGEAVVGDVP